MATVTEVRKYKRFGKYPHWLALSYVRTDVGDRIFSINFHITDRLVGHLLINRRHKIEKPEPWRVGGTIDDHA